MKIDWIKLSADPSVSIVSSQNMTIYNAAVSENDDGTINVGFTTDSVNPSDYTYLKFRLGDIYKGAAIADTDLANYDGGMIFGVLLTDIDKEYKGNIGMSFTTEVPVE